MFCKHENISEMKKIFDFLKKSNGKLSFGVFEVSARKRHFKNYYQNQN